MTEKVKELEDGKIVPLIYDEAFKIMFANPKRLEPLALLLSRVLNEKYEDLKNRIQIVDPYVPNNHLGEKMTERDVVVKLLSSKENYRKIVIEINVLKKKSNAILDRNMHYLGEIFSSGLMQDEKYSNIKSSFLINLNTFFVDNKNKDIFDLYYFRNEHGNIYSKKQKIMNINIAECYRKWYNNDVPKFRNEDEHDLFYLGAAMVTEDVKEFQKCVETINTEIEIQDIMEEVSMTMNKDEEMKIRYYDLQKERKRIYDSIIDEEKEESRIEGYQAGVLHKEKEMIINFYRNEVPIDIIAKSSNLTIDEVNKIIESSK